MKKADFDEWKRIYDAISNCSDIYTVKSFKPWESEAGKQFITVQLVARDEEENEPEPEVKEEVSNEETEDSPSFDSFYDDDDVGKVARTLES